MSVENIQQQDSQPSETSPAKAQRLFVIELWFENRELVKEMVKHVLFFGGLIGSLSGFHRLLVISNLPLDQIDLLNKVHFYMYVVVLVVFALTFVIKVIYWEVRGIRQ